MFSKPLAVALLAVACITAAAGGAYVAVRQNAPAPVADTGQPAEAAPATAGVPETEAVVAPPAAPAPVLETPRPAPIAAETPARTARPLPEPPAPAVRQAAPPARPAPRDNGPASRPTGVAAAAEPPPPSSAPAAEPAPAARLDPPAAAEPARAEPARVDPPPPPAPEVVELVIPAASVIGLQVETAVSSERARLEDRVEARVMRDVSIDGRTAVPAGARAIGSVTLVEKGGKMKERARVGVRFHTLVLADGTQLPIRTEAIVREGESPTGESARKIGGAAVGGAILGAIMGGKKGAIVGGATGAAGGTAVVMAGDRNAATLPVGAVVTVRLSSPATVEVEKS